MTVIYGTRKEAKEYGGVYYFTGKPCKHNHISKRLSSNGSCVDCNSEYLARVQKNNPERLREHCRQYRLRNPEYFRIKDSTKLKKESPLAKKNRLKRSSKYYQKNKIELDKKNKLYRINEKINNPEAEKIRTKKYRQNHPERIRDLMRKRRAIKNGVISDNIVSIDIFKRDNWKCKICGIALNKHGKIPDKDTPTIDHIVPLSKGGSHTYDNVQTVCYICNCKKGNR